ncbi:uncharacterized protein LOC114254698 isoform X2 [Monomorium pharaonis]|uniref:uncharacterized protein LOC114254698 isoform X2 n=1 Tax=Monomorium pharaonis TaxID=307658 RepID=UPI001746BBA4|nr:uncharacterized protein LOC114254698 isoform X2 [Monomorium pharaonis]
MNISRMSERIEIINQYYVALEYKIDKREALEKISTLHFKLKIKDVNNFTDRFSQTASIIEKNLSIFKSACDHIDEVTNLLEYLYSVSTKMMFNQFPNLSLMSIWLEDIVAAKILAMKLNKNVTFINANFEFCNGDKINLDTCTSSVYNLFYDGKWQIPVKGTYWIYDNNICAQTTWEDLNRCKKSAEKASKNWRILPMSSRIEILNNLSTALHCNGKFQLAMEIKEWLQYLKTFENTLSCYQDEKFEISNIHTAKGIVTLINKDESTLFCHLTFALTLGNCVIIKLRVF